MQRVIVLDGLEQRRRFSRDESHCVDGMASQFADCDLGPVVNRFVFDFQQPEQAIRGDAGSRPPNANRDLVVGEIADRLDAGSGQEMEFFVVQPHNVGEACLQTRDGPFLAQFVQHVCL